MGKIYARHIYEGKITIADVPEKWVDATKQAYLELYGEPLEKPVAGAKKTSRKKK